MVEGKAVKKMYTRNGAVATDLKDDPRSAEKSVVSVSGGQEAPTAAATRNVVVLMPFGGADDPERRRAILNFSRLKYIIENHCAVAPIEPGLTGMRLDYDVKVVRTFTDSIPQVALRKIDEADIIIALMSEHNFTVTYELGYRRALGRAVILIADSKDDLPIYEANVNYSNWKQANITAEIDRIVASEWPELADFDADIPETLKQAIDARDGKLVNELQSALKETEYRFVEPLPPSAQMLRGMLSESVDRFYPFSLVEVTFSKYGEFADPDAPAKVVDFDDEFSKLYGYTGRTAARADRPLTLGRLLKKMAKFSDRDDWELFLKDQEQLTDNVVKNYELAYANVPLKINSRHPDDGFKGKSYLPCMAAVVIDGDTAGPHRMYLLIAYIKWGDVTVNCPAQRVEG
jgi:nucleoside 2-deoxyribosyltransferase